METWRTLKWQELDSVLLPSDKKFLQEFNFCGTAIFLYFAGTKVLPLRKTGFSCSLGINLCHLQEVAFNFILIVYDTGQVTQESVSLYYDYILF